GRPAVPDISVQLIEGTSELRVPPTSAPTRRFEVRTPAVNLGVRGTEFRAGVEAAGARSRLEVLEGRVAADAEKGSVSVPAGRGIVATPGEPVAAPRALPAAPDLAGLPPRLERLPLRLGWPAVPGAVAYRAQVFAANAPDQLLLDATPAAPEARWADLPDGRYVLRVRARDASGLEGHDAGRPFELKARPDAPFTLAPAPDAKAYGDAASLTWARVEVAERYHVQVAGDGGFASPLFDRDDVSSPAATVPLPPGLYQWRVASIAAGRDHGPFGDPVRFEQRAVPASPALEPPQVSPDGLQVRWGQLQPGQTVHFQVAEDAAFTRLVAEQRTTEQPVVVATPAPGAYYLRARTIDADGFEGPFGGAQRVDVPRSNWWLLMPAVMLIFLF
ncbi:MAG: FecR domain-containing protein, partial [Rhizobacter sp.]